MLRKKYCETDNNGSAIILKIESCSFLLSIVIWHDLIFEINKTRKVMQTSRVSLEVVETEIEATEEMFEKYRNNGYNSA